MAHPPVAPDYPIGLQDGEVLALFGTRPVWPVPMEQTHTVYGRRIKMTLEWVDDVPDPERYDRALRSRIELARNRAQRKVRAR